MFILEALAIGDAYGIGFEFQPPETFALNDLSAYRPHGLHPIPLGNYSDDTQRAMANAEVILEKGASATQLDFADAYVRVFHRDPRLGYSKNMHALLSSCTTGAELLEKVQGTGLTGGAVMGVAPCGLMKDERDVIHLARTQASVTHRSETAALAAILVALAVFHARRGVKPEDLWITIYTKFTQEELSYISFLGHTGEHPVSQNAVDIATAALKAVETGGTLAGVLQAAISFQGDTDTVAAVAMGIASAGKMKNDLPQVLIDGLENGPYGRDYLRSLDARLAALFKPE